MASQSIAYPVTLFCRQQYLCQHERPSWWWFWFAVCVPAVTSVLAIGGIGGLAIGLAGREICENLLNGFLIMSTVSDSSGSSSSGTSSSSRACEEATISTGTRAAVLVAGAATHALRCWIKSRQPAFNLFLLCICLYGSSWPSSCNAVLFGAHHGLQAASITDHHCMCLLRAFACRIHLKLVMRSHSSTTTRQLRAL
jgi:hypothetical protein